MKIFRSFAVCAAALVVPGVNQSKAVHYIPNCSEFELYKQLVEAQIFGAHYVVIDDVPPTLFKAPRSSAVLKAALENTRERKISWFSNRTGRGKVPPECTIKYKIILIMNGDISQNEHAKAVLSRCYTVEHLPSGESTLAFAEEQGILPKTMVEKLRGIGVPPYLDIRFLKKLLVTYKEGLDWQQSYREYIKDQIRGH